MRVAIWLRTLPTPVVRTHPHSRVKQCIYPMLGFKSFVNAATTISRIELVQKMRKGQFGMAELKSRVGARVLQVWESVLAA